jgi:hypothetical protein
MRKPRTNILLLTAIFAVVGLVGQAWLASESDIPSLARWDSETAASPVEPLKRTDLASATIPDEPVRTQGLATHSPAMPPQQLSDDASVLVAEMCDLQLMAQGTGLTLDSSEWASFATVMLRFQAIRHTYEAMIADLKLIAPGHYRVEIPVYASAGDKLRGQFSTELRAELGEPAALEVMAKLGDRLEGRFAGFGAGVQTLDITVDPAGEPGDVQLARTVRYWNSAAGRDRLTTRREVHFPVLEDPTGDSWSALLARVDAAGAENGPR